MSPQLRTRNHGLIHGAIERGKEFPFSAPPLDCWVDESANRSIVTQIGDTMKTTNIRELKHDTSKVLTWVEQGHAVEITRRNHVVAILSPPPPRDSADIKRPDFSARLKAMWGDRQLQTSWSDVIGDDRGNR